MTMPWRVLNFIGFFLGVIFALCEWLSLPEFHTSPLVVGILWLTTALGQLEHALQGETK